MEFYTKAFFVGLAIFVGYLLMLVLQPFAGSMAWAIFLAFILFPFHGWLTRKLKNRPGTSAGIITGLTPFALLTPLTLLGIAFANQARALIDFLRSRDLHWDNSLLLEIEKYPVIGAAARFAREELQINAADIQDWVTRTAEASLGRVGSLGSGIVLGALGTLVLGRRSRAAAVASGLALMAGSACTRFGVFEAGQASARDPKYTVVPQRERLDQRSTAG